MVTKFKVNDKRKNRFSLFYSFILCISFILLVLFGGDLKAQTIVNANYYFDALNGNDNSSGTTPFTAWKSVNKFNSTNFPVGSIVAFRDSMDYIGVWTIEEDGTLNNPITITNWYGASSEKYPRFINSIALTGWTQTAGYNNVWQASATVGSGISAVYFDCTDSLRWGIHRTSLSELTSEFRVYYTGGQIYVYSTTNPSSRYNQVRYGNIGTSGVPASSHGIYINGASYITLQYIDAAMNTYNGIRTNGGSSNIKVYDCNMYYNGRGTNDNGNGIELVNAANVEVKRCTVYENSSHGPYVYGLNGTVSNNILFDSCVIYDNHHTIGFDLNGNGGIVSNITYRNNIIFESAWYPYRIQNPTDYSPANFIAAQGGWQQAYNVYYYNNLIYVRTGNGFQIESEVDSVYIYNNTFAVIESFNQFCVPLYRGGGDAAHIEIRNNIFYTTRSYRACDSRGGANIIKSNNLYYRTDGATGQNDLTYIAFGPGDITGNPLFTNLSLRDFTLQSGSPAINVGATLGAPYDVDILGVSRPVGSSYDIGVYEYTNGVIIDDTPPQVVNAATTNSTTLVVNFSEQLNSNTAQNINNYSINNGITVSSAVFSGTQVTLTTSAHVSGAYIVTVNNVTDLAGNVVNPNNNTAAYEYQSGSGLFKFPVEQVVASVTPEPTHTGNKTIDGKGFNQGDPDSRWAGDTMPEWLVYDLGDVQVLNQTKLSFFYWNNGRIYNYSLQVSTDSISWNELRTNVQSASGEWSIENLEPVEARYIKIIFLANNQGTWAGLWEAEFWGNQNTDVTPPQVVSAVLTNSNKLVINFSEVLNSSTAQNKSNYSISNGISVSSAVLSGKQVTLTTSTHSTGTYAVTINNVTDLAGNVVDPFHKTANYISAIDNVRPYFTRLTMTSSTSITVNFSEKLDPVKATNRNNYSINYNRTIYSVVLLPDSMSVKLTTTYHMLKKDYTLTISNITDRAGNIISPNPKLVIYRRSSSGTTSPIRNPIEGAISNYWDPNYLPEKTIDGMGMGNPGSRWMSSTIMPDTLCLDMGNIYTMDSLRISFYKWDSGILFKYSVLGSKDSLTWEPVVTDIWSDSLEWTDIEFDSTQARFVKLVLSESNQNEPASIWEIELFGPAGVTGINNETEIPNSYSLSQNYPNPFNPATTISYTIPEKSQVSLKIFDMLGAEVIEIINGELEPGEYKVDFNASNLTSGVYFYRLETKSFIETKKMILLK